MVKNEVIDCQLTLYQALLWRVNLVKLMAMASILPNKAGGREYQDIVLHYKRVFRKNKRLWSQWRVDSLRHQKLATIHRVTALSLSMRMMIVGSEMT